MPRLKTLLLLLGLFPLKSLSQDHRLDTTLIVPVAVDRLNRIELRIQSYADSLNYLSSEEFPKFLFDTCLDLDRALWINLEPTTSIRWSVLKRVTKREALDRIVRSTDKRLKLRCKNVEKSWRNIPYLKKSFLELARMRIKEMS